MRRAAILPVVVLCSLLFAFPAFAGPDQVISLEGSGDYLEGVFSSEMTKFINDFKTAVKPTNVEIYSRYCYSSSSHPRYEKDMNPDLRAVICSAQHSGPLAIELQNQRAENAKLKAENVNKNSELAKKNAEIAALKKQLAAQVNENKVLSQKNKKLEAETTRLAGTVVTLQSEKEMLGQSLTKVNKFREYFFGALIALGIAALALLMYAFAYRRMGRKLENALVREGDEMARANNLEEKFENVLRAEAKRKADTGRKPDGPPPPADSG